ncbi:YcjF family protein [Pseudoroseicyclus tamaricis]|uniref:TIGR01620 family protein n=1 Tax=Pseudoroseicyclus tamaricis TaxID=2705421 RepID=A0A6B2JVR7_9RHOB|nr:TIGR01620 family protein [Pseudoroseicyclus tamaricis]NDV01995.1 TIGR01620 family protein [Pseudoroseicyclus tamaricis]
MSRGPVYIDLDEEAEAARPETAPPVPESLPQGAAMQRAAALAARRPSPLRRLFLSFLGALLVFALSVAAWRWVEGLVLAYPLLGLIATVLVTGTVLFLVLLAIKELAAFARLGRLEELQAAAASAASLAEARTVVKSLERLYQGRADVAWGLDRLKEREDDIMDGPALMAMAERALLEPLDNAARREIEVSARTVATATALVPLALADVVTALAANMRMIRRIGEIYGGRAGTLGAWRLVRAVMTHLVATGAVAVGDDLIHSVAGGSILTRVSRRFGEGIVNGALTARVGVAAMEICRPLPFVALRKPSVTNLVTRGLTGLFGVGKEPAPPAE